MRRFAKGMGVVAVAVGVAAASSDFWQYSEYAEKIRADETVSNSLDQQLSQSEERLALKEQGIREFLHQRMTFAKLVDLFEQLNEGNDKLVHYMHDYYPAASEREIAARNAVQFILSSLPKASPTRAAELNRIRSEFDRLFPRAVALSL